MSNLGQQEILKSIDVDKNYIESIELSTDTGTKRMQATFHKNAVNERNNYIYKQKEVFEFYKENVLKILHDKISKKLPKSKTSDFNDEQQKILNLQDIVQYINPNMSDSFKLGFTYLISLINDEVSLEQLNCIINDFISKFKNIGIILTKDDFNYTMFTEKYMIKYFENINLNEEDFSVKMKECFDDIYWECPNMITHLKMCLQHITSKYSKELKECTKNIIEEKLKEENLKQENVIEEYIQKREKLEELISKDEYLNLNLFLENNKNIDDYLENSRIRIDMFNEFHPNHDYNSMDDEDKLTYNQSILELYNTLKELKEYYRYENIINDLITKYKNKTTTNNLYEQKEKEISNEEKTRIKIYNDYLKANTKGLFRPINKKKVKLLKLKMNDHIKVLDQLYSELFEMETEVNLEKNGNDATTIYELLIISFSSFYYLEKEMNKLLEGDSNRTLKDEIESYIRFIYSPHNIFIRKINAFTDYEIEDIIADKYHLLGLNINKEDITSENIDNTMTKIEFIALIQNINNSEISIEDIRLIKEFLEINNQNSNIEKL